MCDFRSEVSWKLDKETLQDLKMLYKSTIPKDSVDKSFKRKHRSGIDGGMLKYD